ncbi:MAG: hypothetical protein KAW13_03315 [Dehalococcoidia bacterium]|nr:hypothetical protein [Dehalococcoidia bacterium]
MKGNKAKLFGVVMALVLAVALASVGVVQDVSADPGILQWSEVTIPEEGAEGDYALWSGSEVGPIAVTPDGGTIFAASGPGLDTLMRSTDGGYIWKQVMTELDNVAATTFLGPIVDIVVSPDWEDDDTVIVATETDVCISGDRGVEFTTMAEPGGIITSLDAIMDEDFRLALVAGSSDNVYLMTWPLGGWVPQEVTPAYSVLDVVFSTDYATDAQIVAVVTNGALTWVQAKFGDSAWGATITNATLFDTTTLPTPAPFGSSRACIGLPDDYDAYDPTLFVGVVGDMDEGDVYLITWAGSVWAAIDLNVRDAGVHEDTQTDIWSISVSGDAADATILVGTELLNTSVAPRQYLVYLSEDGGTTWAPSAKQPTGEIEATVAMGSDYVGTKGVESAFSAADDAMMSWNQRGLIDAVITEINDLIPSPGYATNGTLFMVTYDAGMTVNSLWQTTNGGTNWERVFCSTLTNINGEPAACLFDMVRLANTNGVVFVAQKGTVEIRLSADDAATWSRIVAQEDITALAVASLDTLYTGDTDGKLWMTTNGAITWDKPDESQITGEVTSIAVGPEGAILAGDDDGTVYICRDKSIAYELERVGPGAVDTTTNKMYVAFDADYDINATIYAGAAGSDIYRFVIDQSDVWKTITRNTPAAGIDVAELVATDDGTLYAADATADAGVARSVNPTSIIPGQPTFEMMGTLLALPAGATLEMLRVAPGNILFAVNTEPAIDQLLTYTDTLTGKVIPATPTKGATSGDILENQGLARVVLSWEGKIGAMSYEYQVALDEAMLTVIAGASGYTAGQVEDVELWLGTTYYWRVRVGAAGVPTVGAPLLSQWSETWSFNTPLGPGAARPILEYPEPGQQNVVLQPVLEWTGLVDADSYELVVAEDCDWGNLVVEWTGAAALGDRQTYAITTDLEYGTDYCWKVRALSETTESPWSDEGTYTTMAEPTPAEAAPTPAWVWVVIAISAILLIAVIVLIVRTRRAV